MGWFNHQLDGIENSEFTDCLGRQKLQVNEKWCPQISPRGQTCSQILLTRLFTRNRRFCPGCWLVYLLNLEGDHLTWHFFFRAIFLLVFFWKQDPIASWSDEHQTSQEFVDQLNCPWAAVAHFWLVCSYVNWFWEWHSWFCSVNWTYRSVSEIIVCCDRQAKKPMGSSPENQQNLSETKRATMMAWIIGIAALFGALQCLISPCCWRVLHYIAVENYVGSLLVFSRDYQETLPRFQK